jgi:hypothetical protein
MTNHTPSPWRLEPAEVGGRVMACDDRATIVHVPPGNPMNPEVYADARLISAAPDLLEACRAFLAYHDADGESDVEMMLNYADAVEAAKAAIRKATGEPS